jgi:hypothetical protein
MTHGVLYVVYGPGALREYGYSVESLKRVHPSWTVAVIGSEPVKCDKFILFDGNRGTPGRWAKVNLDRLTPFDDTLFLDADTRVFGDLSVGFHALKNGWDMAIVPSKDAKFAHLSEDERDTTRYELGDYLVQFNSGVMWFRKTERVRRLFKLWRSEWERWQDKDQGALLRALHQCPVKLWLMGKPFNGGPVVQHRFGGCRRP